MKDYQYDFQHFISLGKKKTKTKTKTFGLVITILLIALIRVNEISFYFSLKVSVSGQ